MGARPASLQNHKNGTWPSFGDFRFLNFSMIQEIGNPDFLRLFSFFFVS
jgi:hypothetical protein